MRAAIAICLVIFVASTAQAQMAVTDPGNLAQNIQQVLQNAQQIHATAKLVEAQAKNLKNLPDNLRGEFSEDLHQLTSVLNQAEGLSYQMESVAADFERLYGAEVGHVPLDELRGVTRAATQTAMTAQAIASAQRRERTNIERLLAASRAAPGSLGATQAANEIAARQVISLMRLQELHATYQRAVMTREAETQARDREAAHRLHKQVESLSILKEL